MGLRENDHGHRINGEFGFFDWLPTRGSRETDVDNANTAHRQGNTLLLLFNRADCSAFQTCKRVLVIASVIIPCLQATSYAIVG